MLPKDNTVFVGHMLDNCQKALKLTNGISRKDFDQNEILRIALTHPLQIIGEAARHVSTEYCNSHPEIPWKAIIGMRHKVVHDYFDVDEDIVWDTVKIELPELTRLLQKITL
jgi:uncharacterized protein with HEPN domain